MISKSGLHAILALAELTRLRNGEYAGAAAVAEAIGAPPNYLGKLLAVLAGRGLVISQKGLGGGFRLARPAEEISLYEAVDPIDPLYRWSGCILGNKKCSDSEACVLHGHWKAVRETFLDFLRGSTIADVARAGETQTARNN
jgi:Rrf2 family iron-sulfur cluster assembly transcriptional regulator